jgi:hypothetical protein
VFSQYREHGVLLWRGFSFDDFANQVGLAQRSCCLHETAVECACAVLHLQSTLLLHPSYSCPQITLIELGICSSCWLNLRCTGQHMREPAFGRFIFLQLNDMLQLLLLLLSHVCSCMATA